LQDKKDCDIISEIHCDEVMNCYKILKNREAYRTGMEKDIEKGRDGDSGLWTSTGRGRHRLRAPSCGTWLWEHSGADKPKQLKILGIFSA
jgi:hypothetical protein